MQTDQHYINHALEEAQKAYDLDEVPIGAVIVQNNTIIAAAHNLKELQTDCTAHAELLAIQKAQYHLNDWRLTECTIYTTLEPCPMCAGAILHARIKRLVYCAPDLKWGAVETKVNLFKENLFNHTTIVEYLPSEHAKKLLQDFFKALRQNK